MDREISLRIMFSFSNCFVLIKQKMDNNGRSHNKRFGKSGGVAR